MATATIQSQLTFPELSNRLNNKTLMAIAEVLETDLEWFSDAVWAETNQPTSHVHVRRHNEPQGETRRINKGIKSVTSGTEKITEPLSFYETESVIDERLVQLAGNKAKFRSDEDLGIFNGLMKQVSEDLLYGSVATNPDGINGLLTRYNALSLENVWDSGDTGNTSILVCQWNTNRGVFLGYPSGSSTMGIRTQDEGRQRVEDDAGDHFWAWITHFYFDMGLVLRDDKSFQRIANVDPDAVTAAASTADNALIKAINKMPGRGKGATVYVNTDTLSKMEILAKDKTNVNYQVSNAFGEPLVTFKGKPIRVWDSLLNTEATVS